MGAAPPCDDSSQLLTSLHTTDQKCCCSTMFVVVSVSGSDSLRSCTGAASTVFLCPCLPRISPTEWAEPDTEEHSFTLLHSYWYITGALTLQGNPATRSTEPPAQKQTLLPLVSSFCLKK